METFKELRVFSMLGTDKVVVGAVRCPLNATFDLVRKEIEMDDLVSYSFDFIILDSVLRAKQEARWQVHGMEVLIKRKQDGEPGGKRRCVGNGLEDVKGGTCSSFEHSPGTGLDEVADCQSSNERRLEASKKKVHLWSAESQLKSRLVPSDILLRWEYEVERVRARLKGRGREDKFDIYTRDEAGEVIVKVWCLECGRTYGSGKDPLKSAYRTLSNFHQSHIRSATHRENYAANHGVDPDALPATQKTHKEEIEAAMLEVCNFNSSHVGASFEIVQLTLGNFNNKHHVFMRCTVDDQWLHLVPKCGTSTEAIMLRHVQSTAHRTAALMQKPHNKPAEGRQGLAGLDAASAATNGALLGHVCAKLRCKESVKVEFEQSNEASSDWEYGHRGSAEDNGSEGDVESGDVSGALLLSCSGSAFDEFLSSAESSFKGCEDLADVSENSSFESGSRTLEEQGNPNHSSDLLAGLCWGMWQAEVEIGDVVVAVKGLLADEKGGAEWWAEPHVVTSLSSRGQEYKISGCFRHSKCERISHGEPFPNLSCSFCKQIPGCSDFREKALLWTKLPGP